MRTETIKVAGGADRTITVRSTAHGPVLSDVVDGVRGRGSRPGQRAPTRDATYAVVARLDRP